LGRCVGHTQQQLGSEFSACSCVCHHTLAAAACATGAPLNFAHTPWHASC
jgi:hypothetical protein